MRAAQTASTFATILFTAAQYVSTVPIEEERRKEGFLVRNPLLARFLSEVQNGGGRNKIIMLVRR